MHPCHSLILSAPDHQVKELQRETACDPTLQTVKKAILDALPDTKDELSAAIHQYFDIRDELSLRDGVIFKSKPCIIPPTRRQKIKQKPDDSHIRVQGFFRRARETVYWPCMNAEIADYTQKCDVRMSFQSKSPSRPWEKVATDFFTLLEKNYLCPAQYTTSGYFEVDQLHRKTGTVIITKLKRLFCHTWNT